MDHFVHEQNILNYKKLIAASELDPKRNETRHVQLLDLLAEEIAKETEPLNEPH